MFNLSIIFLIFFTLKAYSETHLVPQNPEDQGPNIPTIGSSLFDKIFSDIGEKGDAQYSVPYPLARFVQKIEDDAKYVHTILPFSRSLQRPVDLSYDPLLNPRIVFTPYHLSTANSLVLGKIFFGFVQAKDQLEVISFNDEAGRFEYQIITNYSKTPKVYYVERGKCLSCHQGQAPIFSPPGWNDTSVGIMGKLLDTRLDIEGKTRNDFISELFGVGRTNELIATFDSFVRKADNIAFGERVWLFGCSEDSACRLGLLLKTLARTSLLSAEYISYAEGVIARSPLMQQVRFSSFLTSYDLDATAITLKYGGLKEVVTNPVALLEIISQIFNLAGENNPSSKRSRTISETDVSQIYSKFSQTDYDLLRETFSNVNQIAETLIQLHQEGHTIFDSSALNAPEIMFTLLSHIGSRNAEIYQFWVNKKTPDKKLFDGSIIPIFNTPELNLFSRHCHKCHAVGFNFPPQFLLGTEDQVLEKIKTMKNKIIYKLENDLMPPNPVAREVLKKSGDYETLIDYLGQL